MIVYATKDGSVAEDGEDDHSPFTKAFLTHIDEARLDIRLMFSKVRDTVLQSTQNRQQPFTYGSLARRRTVLQGGGKVTRRLPISRESPHPVPLRPHRPGDAAALRCKLAEASLLGDRQSEGVLR